MRTLLFCVAALGLFLCALHQHSRAMRRAAMHGGRVSLERAYADYERSGAVPSSGPHARFRPFTNCVSVVGVSYQCVLATDLLNSKANGFLAIATNGTVLWIDKARAPKIVDASYRAPLFGGGL